MKAEKTPLRYIVQRIMRTIFKSETGEKDLQPTFMTVAKGSSLIFKSETGKKELQRRTCYHSRPPLLTAR